MNTAQKILSMFGLGDDPETATRAHQWVDEGATLLDVRTAGEFAGGHLKGALNIPVQELSARKSEVPGGRVVVYCRSGGRSASAASFLSREGREVLDLGGMRAWGRPDDIVR